MKTWLVIGGIIIGVVAVASIVVGALAANGVFNGNDKTICPAGQYPITGNNTVRCVDKGLFDDKPIIYLYPEKEMLAV